MMKRNEESKLWKQAALELAEEQEKELKEWASAHPEEEAGLQNRLEKMQEKIGAWLLGE